MSASILDVLSQQLDGDVVKQMSAQLGADERTVNNAITAALPMLLGGLARNSANPQGAEALSFALARDHDGGIFDNLVGFLGGAAMLEQGRTFSDTSSAERRMLWLRY